MVLLVLLMEIHRDIPLHPQYMYFYLSYIKGINATNNLIRKPYVMVMRYIIHSLMHKDLLSCYIIHICFADACL
jgi:hypothetical protein